MKDIKSRSSLEQKPLENVSRSDQTVSQKTHITSEDLKPELLDEVAKMLRSEQAAMNDQLLKHRGSMLDSSRRQYTNTVKECVDGIDLIKSLKDAQETSGSSSQERCENAILGSNNKTLARLFEQAVVDRKKMADQTIGEVKNMIDTYNKIKGQISIYNAMPKTYKKQKQRSMDNLW